MNSRYFLVAGLALALMGQGCFTPAPSVQDEQPVEAVAAEESPIVEPVPEASPEAVAAPSPTPSPTPAPKPAPKADALVKPKTVVVEMKDNAFSPQIIAITAGDTIVWKNVGANNHTSKGIRNGPLVWNSGNVAPGQTYSRTFTAVGRFGYSCGIHAGMTGEVIVGEANAAGQ
jgi:plastocyanin